MSRPPRSRLDRSEINLLKHLVRHAPIGFPLAVPIKLRPAFLPLWRKHLIEIWYRQDRDSVGGRRTQFISITVDGHRRIHTLLAGQLRASGIQGQGSTDDQPSQPQQVDGD